MELQAAVEKELRALVASNMALEMSEAEAHEKFGNKLVVASLGAMVKDGEGENLRIRLQYDGSHGVPVNDNIRVRDRDQVPAAPDIKRVLRQVHVEGGVPVGVKLDVIGAHHLVPIAPCDWHLLGCIFINRTGTFGVASAAYWWGRLAGAVVRLLHHLSAHYHALYVLLVADDAIAISTDAHFRISLMYVFLLMDFLATPLTWSKDLGGTLLNFFFEEKKNSHTKFVTRTQRVGASQLRKSGRFHPTATKKCRSGCIGAGHIQEVARISKLLTTAAQEPIWLERSQVGRGQPSWPTQIGFAWGATAEFVTSG